MTSLASFTVLRSNPTDQKAAELARWLADHATDYNQAKWMHPGSIK